ncbi:class I SAM-dependent methyltransferase [Lewinella sp. JB7]|uniref:class I SAM-dependent methyltransferase n=1 Tax=Lewinella sp. JB7 TaxID=2962887 RepID=UPI0020C9C4E6|nr:class I SAM-dependent methyltransferase [Lewinella sp. JB7]MCP9236154.1 class I SAM-dependent methyltransferase [Lewinella sp. JB7]
MANWLLKAAVQKTISYLPFKERVNFFFQKYITRGVDLTDEHFGYKLDAARDHVRYFRKYGQTPAAQARVLELGTGWYPIVPAALFLVGFERIVSVDIRNWMTAERQVIALRKLLAYHDDGRLATYLPGVLTDRLTVLRELCKTPESLTVDQISSRIRLDARVMDATRLDFPDDHFDLICSNNTFEHVYPKVLARILGEFKRVVKPNGVMSHFVDLSDHFAHLDSSINIYNFLRFSHRQWAMLDNSIQPQNRLRWPDYLAMYAALGIPVREQEVRPGNLANLRSVPVHADIGPYPDEELAISHGYLVS